MAKYADHLPLKRQVRMYRRAGLVVTSQTPWDQVHALSKALQPAHARLLEHGVGLRGGLPKEPGVGQLRDLLTPT